MAVGFNKRTMLDLDPDYEDGHICEAKRRCLVEESGQEQAQLHLVEVVVHQLDAALVPKESEALQLQEQVEACQRMLHILRFGVTSIYYKNFLRTTDTLVATSNNDSQSPVHPTVLRLMGLSGASGPKTRGIFQKPFTPENSTPETVVGVNTTEEGETEEDEGEEEEREEADDQVAEGDDKVRAATLKMPRYVPPMLPKPPEVCAASVRMERHRIKRRLIVGNVSKWLPEDLRKDAASHKWMLYVRGPTDSPNISDVVAKVRYFLHPSYRPHDIVDTVYPYYLARRGWGEFPVRVQVHFTLAGNRPIDIIHNLKLDRTYSGLQTLGGETVVDAWLKNLPANHRGETDLELNQIETEKQTSTFQQGVNSTIQQLGTAVVEDQNLPVTLKKEPKEKIEDKDPNTDVDEFKSGEKVMDVEREQKVKVEEDIPENEVSCSEYPHSSMNEFILHNLPDHDYLGCNTFKLKCTLCVGRCYPNVSRENVELKAQCVLHQKDGDELTFCSVPSFNSVKKSPEQSQVVNQEITIPDVHRVRFVKQECAEGITSDGSEFPETFVQRNSITSHTSLVECIDGEGNLICVSLLKPSIPTKHHHQRDVLIHSPGARRQHSVSEGISTPVSRLVGSKVEVKNNGVFQKTMAFAPFTSIQAGMSLLKKNCLASLLAVPVNSCSVSYLPEFEGSRLMLGRHQAQNLRIEQDNEAESLLKMISSVFSKVADDRNAVTWLLRLLPITDERVNKDLEFKREYPYCAASSDVFLAWPVGKRHCTERLRAHAARGILQNIDQSRFGMWSVRHIMNWSRLHGLTPLPSIANFGEQIVAKNLPASILSLEFTATEPSEVQDWLESVGEASKTSEENENVNVEELDSSLADCEKPVRTKERNDSVVWMHSDIGLCNFYRDSLEQLDIKLTAEMLCPGVLYPAVEELLFQVSQSLCEDLLRRSLRQAWNRCKEMPDEITLPDVQEALLTRTEFDILTNSGLGVQAYDTSNYS